MSLWRATGAALLCLAAGLGGCKKHHGGGSAPPPPPPPPAVDLDVDTDRDGAVETSDEDENSEDLWTPTAGAVFTFNEDDDDGNGSEDHLDTVVNGAADADDLARIFLRQFAVPAGGTVTIGVTPASAQSSVRVFRNNSGTWTSVYAGGASFTIPETDVAAGEIELGIEARARISPTWDGYVTLALDIRDSTGASAGTDAVQLRCAPLLLCNDTWKKDHVYVVSITSGSTANGAFRSVMSSTCASAGVAYTVVPGTSYSGDRWIQDSSESGIEHLTAAGVPRRRVNDVLQMARWRPVDAWCDDYLLGPDFGMVRRFSSNTSSLNYGGNLEIVPSHTTPTGGDHRWGRCLVGGGTSSPIGGGTPITRVMVQAYRDYLNALGLQGPHLTISTEWLAVAHVDELVEFVPAPALSRGWAAVVSSPDLAKSLLSAVEAGGGGSKLVFAGRSGWETTVSAILADTALMAYNAEVQSRIDTMKTYLMTEVGLDDSEIVEVPVLYQDVGGGASAYSPGMQNLVVIPSATGTTTYLVVADPEGPDDPTDVWAADAKSKLEALGTSGSPVVVTFVDVFFSYHDLLGETHCGTNWYSTPPSQDWWDY